VYGDRFLLASPLDSYEQLRDVDGGVFELKADENPQKVEVEFEVGAGIEIGPEAGVEVELGGE
jgi:hypothetical protein